MILAAIIAVLAITYAAAHAARLTLAWRHMSLTTSTEAAPSITVLQPILSGDPALPATLAVGPERAPDARFVWLVDDDDAEGQLVAHRLAMGREGITVVTGRPPQDGENPKTLKLIRGAAHADNADVVAVLDDDTTLLRGGLDRLAHEAAAAGGLATALPTWGRRPQSAAEALVAGFVDGQGASAYLAMARLGRNRTINGMAYAMDVGVLRAAGGFDAIGHAVTDDWAVAQAFTRSNRPLVQTAVPAQVAVTVPDLPAALRLLRRWTIFAHRYVVANADGAIMALVLLPAVVPLAGLIVAGFAGPVAVAAWITMLVGRAALHRRLVRALGGGGAAPLWASVGAELALPLLSLMATVRPNHIRWRSRRMRLTRDGIRYE